MLKRSGIRLAALLVVVAAFAVAAPVALSGSPPAHPKVLSGCSTVSGPFGHWLRDGEGQLFAFVIKKGPQVRISSRGAAALVKIVKPGDNVSVSGCVVNRAFRAKTVTANSKTISV
jgi:hypothetical protein